ncbi:MAG TPA: hypothetical protein DCY94_01750 [Firmicutes bacterium]|nr:hypothetical protein [Bacillota bacterium]
MANKNSSVGKKKIQFKGIKQNFRKKKDNAELVRTDTERPKKKSNKKVRNKVLIVIMIILIVGALSCLSFAVYIIATCPEFDTSELYKSGSSTIYDADMNVIAELGVEKRENVTYDQLPEVLIDAIVSTEDSKFFMHDGIDLLRFGKATIGQLLGQSGAGGGSTLTMQIVKNTYKGKYGLEASGIKGIMRKFKDIYMSVFKVEKTYTKQEILEFYVNQGFLGSGAGGVEQAAQVYFGKSVGELTLPEAALIAGLFQSPSSYNPYANPEKAENRRNQVLNLMVRHGYISEEEAEVAKSIKVEDMLSGYNFSYSEWQGFIDTMVEDVIKRTGNDPYEVAMKVYTTLKTDKQKVINQLYAGEIFPDKNYKWKNDVVQCGIAITDVKTGAIVAVGNGRNKEGKERTYNYATKIKRHPGSTAKPIFDYGPAIEYASWGTGTTVIDDKYSYSNGQSINNVDFGYKGIMTAKKALAQSRNIPALQAFQATNQKQKYDFVTGLGITPELHNNEILESSSIGAFDGVSPMELSAAYGTFARGGYYIEPYTFTKIEYTDSNDTFVYTPTRTKAMSEETAFMVNMILKYAVTSGAIGVGSVSGTDLASKTGTSSVSNETIKSLGLHPKAIRDSWQVSYSPDYSIAFWYGYDEITKEHYMIDSEGWTARRQIVRALTPRIMNKNSRWSQPSGVTTVEIELETNPVQLASEFTPENLRSTEYFRKGTEPTEVSPRFSQLDNVTNLSYTTNGNQIQLTWSPIATPDPIDQGYLENYFQTNYARWAESYLNKRIEYNNGNIGTVVYEVFGKNPDGTLNSLGTTSGTTFNTSLYNATNATYVVKSTYTIFKANASSGSMVNVRLSSGGDVTIPGTGEDDNEGNEDNLNQ